MAKNLKNNDTNVAAIMNSVDKTLAQKGDEIFAYISSSLVSYTATSLKETMQEEVMDYVVCDLCD